MKKLFENDLFIIYENVNKDFEVFNKCDHDLNLYLNCLDDNLLIAKKDYIFLFEGMYSECIIDCLMNESYEVV